MKITSILGKNTLEFDTETGHFIWIDCYRKPKYNGKRAEHKTLNGYLYIKANQKQHSASRLAYTLAYNTHPGELQIDHINRIRDDNRPENLRLVTSSQQCFNKEYRTNKSNARGVSLHKKTGLYRARYKNKTTYHKTVAEASQNYQKMFLEDYAQLPKKFNHGRDAN